MFRGPIFFTGLPHIHGGPNAGEELFGSARITDDFNADMDIDYLAENAECLGRDVTKDHERYLLQQDSEETGLDDESSANAPVADIPADAIPPREAVL